VWDASVFCLLQMGIMTLWLAVHFDSEGGMTVFWALEHILS
jgi:hypothetical protein